MLGTSGASGGTSRLSHVARLTRAEGARDGSGGRGRAGRGAASQWGVGDPTGWVGLLQRRTALAGAGSSSSSQVCSGGSRFARTSLLRPLASSGSSGRRPAGGASAPAPSLRSASSLWSAACGSWSPAALPCTVAVSSPGPAPITRACWSLLFNRTARWIPLCTRGREGPVDMAAGELWSSGRVSPCTPAAAHWPGKA
ncbi:hypothetical protein K458DRAFT_45396 [Lentithecium fluviatile CBS 122367]|uniref:Uncharacterized protein n=1 Tax=Lentithecium fluviatile CBS 122367 TaxID=1168545 RepID=A0A6G1IYP4_9PLEO|nr:hypothetical protein K458DRAFT_45396 [Lentithecium fluviatile CBS 122367]